MRILICGGRTYGWNAANEGGYRTKDFAACKLFNDTLDGYLQKGDVRLVSGGAKGADRLAEEWAKMRQVPIYIFHAPWIKYEKRAGPIRNQMMLYEATPDLVLAFPGGAGTADMVKRAKAVGIEVRKINEA
jgi:hypothetical protein